MKFTCPFCCCMKVRKVVPKSRAHIKYVPTNSRRCMICHRSWWTPRK